MRKARKIDDDLRTVTETVIVPVRMVVEYNPHVPGAREAVIKECTPHLDRFGYGIEHGAFSVKVRDVLYDQITVEKPKKGRKSRK